MGNKILYGMFKIILGGCIYYLLEITARGYSHWSMFFLGGLCFYGCGVVHSRLGNSVPIWCKMVWCMIIITVLEFFTGVIVNVILGWDIWDYSTMPFNVLGQICVPFMLLWYGVSYLAIVINKICDAFTIGGKLWDVK